MSKEGFFHRWARLKSAGDSAAPIEPEPAGREYLRAGAGPASARPDPLPGPDTLAGFEPVAQTVPHPPVAPVAPNPPAGQERRQPTLDDVARLGPDSDFSAFVGQGVDKAVQRLALKKLFSDPHFSLTDGLDIYIDDYTRADPVPAAMLASLQHARSVFARLLDDDKNQREPGQAPKEGPTDPDPSSQGNA